MQGIGAALLVGSAVILGPSLVRRDTVRYSWVRSFGADVLTEPIGIASLGGNLYVTDAVRNAIVVFDSAGATLATLTEAVTGLRRPMHLTARDDHLYVAEYLDDRIAVLDTAGRRVRTMGGRSGTGPGELDAPGGVVPLGGDVAVADFYNHRVQILSEDTARILGRPGRLRRGRLHYPTDIAVADSLIYVADAYNHRIQVFHPDGSVARRWGGPLGVGVPGPFRGWFRVATGIAVHGGRTYVADFLNHRVQIFTNRGRYLGQVADSLQHPTDVTVSEHGTLYVVDVGTRRVVQLGPATPGRRPGRR